MMPWRAAHLRLTTDPEWMGEYWQAGGTWGDYTVRVTQHGGDELMVWHTHRPRLHQKHATGCLAPGHRIAPYVTRQNKTSR